MWEDEIVEETRRIRETYAAQFNYDLEAMYRDLKEQEQQSEHPKISLPPRQPIQMMIYKSAKAASA